MISIVAVDENWGIGKNNAMPWRIPGEQLFFKETTLGKTIVMGRRTLESLPGGRPLPGRSNIVLTRSMDYTVKGATVVRSPEELMNVVGDLDSDDIFLIGGAQIYRLLIPYCSKAYVTKVAGSYDVDTHHPDLDSDPNWVVVDKSPSITAPNGIVYARYIYENMGLATL